MHAITSRNPMLPLLAAMQAFIPRAQMLALKEITAQSRELDECLTALAATIAAMPLTGQTDGQGAKAIVHLHYFSGQFDWWITEKDAGDADDEHPGRQLQAFGLASLFAVEMGYIDLHEIGRHMSTNIDLHWTPKTVGECRAEAEAKRRDW